MAGIWLISSCQSDDLQNQVYEVEIYLTDDPLDAEEVNVEIIGVVLIGEDESMPIELNTITGVYNLLEFQGDVDTLIASGNYDLNSIKEIRLILGNNNTIKIDGQIFPLTIPSGAESGLKIKINQDLMGQSLVSLLIDFDACKSIKEMNGAYKLSPVIHFKGDRNIRSLDVDYAQLLDSCYTLDFPVQVKNSDGAVSEVNSRDEFISLISNEEIVGVVYPIRFIDENGNSKEVKNHNHAKRYIEMCTEEEKEDYEYIEFDDVIEKIDSCFELIYPLFVLTDADEVFEVSSLEELSQFSDLKGVLLPFTIGDDKNTFEIKNENQFEGLTKKCEEKEEEYTYLELDDVFEKIDSCFELVFPIFVLTENNEVLEVMTFEQLDQLTDVEGILFPFMITDGMSTFQILIEEQLKEYTNDCEEDDDDGKYDDFKELVYKIIACYEISFPVSVELMDSSTMEFSNLEELKEAAENLPIIAFVYDIVITGENGVSHVIKNGNQLMGLLKNCKSNDDDLDLLKDLLDCYELEFPITLKDQSGELVSIENVDQLKEIIDSDVKYDINFPINIIDSNGKEIKVNNKNKLKNLAEDC